MMKKIFLLLKNKKVENYSLAKAADQVMTAAPNCI